MPRKHTKFPFLYVYKKTKTHFVESVSQGLSTLSQYFQVYYTTSELELQKNSFCYKSFIIKKVDLWGLWRVRAHQSYPPPYGPVP